MKWTKKFPKKEGFYWFYGYRFKDKAIPELCVMQVWKIANGFAYVVNGAFCYKEEAGEFYVLEIKQPILPIPALPKIK
jgi:hypothetical protein